MTAAHVEACLRAVAATTQRAVTHRHAAVHTLHPHHLTLAVAAMAGEPGRFFGWRISAPSATAAPTTLTCGNPRSYRHQADMWAGLGRHLRRHPPAPHLQIVVATAEEAALLAHGAETMLSAADDDAAHAASLIHTLAERRTLVGAHGLVAVTELITSHLTCGTAPEHDDDLTTVLSWAEGRPTPPPPPGDPHAHRAVTPASLDRHALAPRLGRAHHDAQAGERRLAALRAARVAHEITPVLTTRFRTLADAVRTAEGILPAATASVVEHACELHQRDTTRAAAVVAGGTRLSTAPSGRRGVIDAAAEEARHDLAAKTLAHEDEYALALARADGRAVAATVTASDGDGVTAVAGSAGRLRSGDTVSIRGRPGSRITVTGATRTRAGVTLALRDAGNLLQRGETVTLVAPAPDPARAAGAIAAAARGAAAGAWVLSDAAPPPEGATPRPDDPTALLETVRRRP